MKAMSIAMLIFAVAGSLAVAAEQPSITVGGCTCTGIKKSTGKPWTESECRSSCELQKSLGNQFGNFASPTLVAQVGTDGPDQRSNQEPTSVKEITRGQMIAGIVVFTLLTCGITGLLGWRIMKQGPRKKKRKYRTDQHKMVVSGTVTTAEAPDPPPAPVEDPPPSAQLSVVKANPPEPLPPPAPLPIKFGEVVDITHHAQEIERVIGSLEAWLNPKTYLWMYWIKELSDFALERFGFQPEIKLFPGGVEMSIQAEHEHDWLKIITLAVREMLPVSLKVVVIEQDEEGCILLLMPEESVRLTVFGEDNVLTMTEGLRQRLLPAVHDQHRRAVGD